MNVILEINGKVREKLFITEQGVTAGRSWDNEIIIKDSYVDSRQIKLCLNDEKLTLEDLGSTNGTEVAGKKIDRDGCIYRYGDLIKIGDTAIRLSKVTTEVAQTKRRSFWFKLVRFFKPLFLLSALIAIACGLQVFESWSYSTESYGAADIFSELFTTILMLFGIASCFALVNKLFKGHASFKEHLIIISFIQVITVITDFIVWIIRFNVQLVSFGQVLDTTVGGVIMSLLIVGALSYITLLGRWKVWLIAIAVSSGIIYSDNAAKLTKEKHEKWSEYSDAEDIIMPPVYLLRDPISVDNYFDEADALFDRLDAQ